MCLPGKTLDRCTLLIFSQPRSTEYDISGSASNVFYMYNIQNIDYINMHVTKQKTVC